MALTRKAAAQVPEVLQKRQLLLGFTMVSPVNDLLRTMTCACLRLSWPQQTAAAVFGLRAESVSWDFLGISWYGYGSKPITSITTYYCHILGNNHQLNSYVKVPKVPGLWPMAHISLSPITNHDYIVVSNMFMKQPASSSADWQVRWDGLNHVETTVVFQRPFAKKNHAFIMANLAPPDLEVGPQELFPKLHIWTSALSLGGDHTVMLPRGWIRRVREWESERVREWVASVSPVYHIIYIYTL